MIGRMLAIASVRLAPLATDWECYTTPGNDILDCVIGDIAGQLGGMATAGSMTALLIFGSLYKAGSGDIRTPAAVLILMSGVLLSIVPAQYKELAVGVLIIALAAAILAVLELYYMEGAQ